MTMQPMFVAEGMNLRDWFAGQVLAARLARPDTSPTELQNSTELAAWAYGVAQALMEQREKIYAAEEQALWGPEFGPQGPGGKAE
ncbi:hypothetical protein [Hyalangium sp.]|uniref:hypothetical protein n=1 Tax=Hyalangium sp. TaxID=2028555 RepID=UPI002D2B7FE2|nr:hypothetical protein [Hyalangium sp.]HYH96578.1 hypothetical protein [Hyalangium sp.]